MVFMARRTAAAADGDHLGLQASTVELCGAKAESDNQMEEVRQLYDTRAQDSAATVKDEERAGLECARYRVSSEVMSDESSECRSLYLTTAHSGWTTAIQRQLEEAPRLNHGLAYQSLGSL